MGINLNATDGWVEPDDVGHVTPHCYIMVGTFTRRGLSCLPRHWVTRVQGSEYKGKV